MEDEIQFMLKCPALSSNKSPFITNFRNTFKNFNDLDINLDINSQFIWLMSNEDSYVISDV